MFAERKRRYQLFEYLIWLIVDIRMKRKFYNLFENCSFLTINRDASAIGKSSKSTEK